MRTLWFGLFYALMLALAFGLGWFVEFWNSPLAEPLCLFRGGDILKPVQLTWEYRTFWALVFGGIALPFLGLLAWIGISLSKIARGYDRSAARHLGQM